jgi:hypothetical protein
MTDIETLARDIAAVRDELAHAAAKALAFNWTVIELAKEVSAAEEHLDALLRAPEGLRRVTMYDGRVVFVDRDDPNTDEQIREALEASE